MLLLLGFRVYIMEEGEFKYGIGEGRKEFCGDGLELEVLDEFMMFKIYVYVYRCFYVCMYMYLCRYICMFVFLCV